MEMLYAANIPLESDSAARADRFKAGLLGSVREGRRPHLLYGTREHKLVGYNPIQLPPMQNSWFDNYNPVNGKLTKESDRANIQGLVADIAPRMKRVTVGYEGEKNAAGQYHGRGVYRFARGDVYEGEYQDDKKHGRGVYRFASGAVYEGEWKDDKKHGRGTFRFADGRVYEGEFKDGKYHGRGVFRSADGDVYEGEYQDGKKHGRGVSRSADGSVYHDGQWKDGQPAN